MENNENQQKSKQPTGKHGETIGINGNQIEVNVIPESNDNGKQWQATETNENQRNFAENNEKTSESNGNQWITTETAGYRRKTMESI